MFRRRGVAKVDWVKVAQAKANRNRRGWVTAVRSLARSLEGYACALAGALAGGVAGGYAAGWVFERSSQENLLRHRGIKDIAEGFADLGE